MATVFSMTLAISIVGLCTLLILKRYEMKTGQVMLGGLRPTVGRFFHRIVMLFERGVPNMLRGFVWRIISVAYAWAGRMFAYVVVGAETLLERTLRSVQEQSQAPRSEGGVSHFLQEVAAHKQRLLRRSPQKRMIFDD